MKFFWTIYFSFMTVFLLVFGLFGTWMIQMTFQHSYEKALKDGEWDNRMYQLAFETSLNSMDSENLSDNMVQVIAVTVTQNRGRKDLSVGKPDGYFRSLSGA